MRSVDSVRIMVPAVSIAAVLLVVPAVACHQTVIASSSEDTLAAWTNYRPDSEPAKFTALLKTIGFLPHGTEKPTQGDDDTVSQASFISAEVTTQRLAKGDALKPSPKGVVGRVLARVDCDPAGHGLHEYGCEKGYKRPDSTFIWLYAPTGIPATQWREIVFKARDSAGVVMWDSVAGHPFNFHKKDTDPGGLWANWDRHPSTARGPDGHLFKRATTSWVSCGSGCCSDEDVGGGGGAGAPPAHS